MRDGLRQPENRGRTLNAGEQLLIKRGSVINQELRVGATGTSNRWVEIGA